MEREIHAYIDGRSFNNKGSGFAVILISKNNKWLRSFAYGKNSVNQSDLLALKFALLSVNKKSESFKTTIFTKNDYIIGLFKKEDGKYIQNPSNNVTIINEIKKIIETRDVVFEKIVSSDIFEMCKNMAIDAIKENKLVDIRR
jgi:ribonuclease HI